MIYYVHGALVDYIEMKAISMTAACVDPEKYAIQAISW